MTKANWDDRIRRADELAMTYSFAAEVLGFYRQVASFQKDLYLYLTKTCGSEVEKRENGSLRQELDLIALLPRFPVFLSVVERVGPEPLASSAAELKQSGVEKWSELLTACWTPESQPSSPADPSHAFFAKAFLQAYGEYLADHTDHPPVTSTPSVCPLCGGRPLVGVLRQEGDGAKRSLICSLCLTEWEYRRIVCPACGEENVEKLAVYTTSDFDHVRVEACDTCGYYIKTVDLTKNGLAVPVVDELATIPLNLWAQEKGYKKLEPNLIGV